MGGVNSRRFTASRACDSISLVILLTVCPMILIMLVRNWYRIN